MIIPTLTGDDYYKCGVCGGHFSDVTFPFTRCQVCSDTICFHCLAIDTNDDICDKCFDND